MKRIAIALDRVQSDECTISEATEIWLKLHADFYDCNNYYSDSEKNKFENRFGMAVTPFHFLANIVDHRYQGKLLNQTQIESAMEYLSVSVNEPQVLSDILKYRAKASPFKAYLFNAEIKPID